MTRKTSTHRPILEALEPRTMLSTGLVGDLSRQAQVDAYLASIRAGGKPRAELSPTRDSGQVKAAQASGRVGQRGPQQLLQQQKRLAQQQKHQLRAQGKILSARSLDNTTVMIQLKQRVKTPLDNAAMYRIPGLNVERATASADGRSVMLTTSPQVGTSYTLTMTSSPTRGRPGTVQTRVAGPTGGSQAAQTLGTIRFDGTPAPLVLAPSSGTGDVTLVQSPSIAVTPPSPSEFPRVVSATSVSNTEVIVQFSVPMSDSALVAQHYEITPENVNPESGRLIVKNVRFQITGTPTNQVVNRASVILTTESQNENDYQVRVANLVDLAGNPLGPAVLATTGQRVDPTVARFQGTPPKAVEKNGKPTLIDTDGDGLPDNVEQRGWEVNVISVNGTVTRRTVTGDIRLADTDGDGLSDYLEATLGSDPRTQDSDADQLGDYAEYNEIYSNLLDQDSDNDGLDDAVEFTFYRTSPVFDDTDGDQLKDGDEIVGNRNPRVADLPRPEFDVGDVNLQLDVRFTETRDQQRRDLETRQISTTLLSSTNLTYTRSDTGNVAAHLEFGYEEKSGFFKTGVQGGRSWTSTDETALSSQREYQNSLSTDKEVTRGSNVERTVQGATMQVAISLRNVSSLAYRVENLQVTAFIQDPLDHSKLTPIATLLPDSEPEDGFTLGPLVTNRGPFIFSNSTIIPSLVESLMANPSGLIFRISNYDIIDESGRNFAFSSQEVVERTSALTLDFGGARSLRAKVSGDPIDENQPGDETEIYRVATSAGQVIDTDLDGDIDDKDRRATFDANGKEVGITLFEALAAVGLARYDEATTPTSILTDDQILGSFSTYVDASGREKIYRIRGVANDTINQKFWEILTPLGVDANADLSRMVLKTGSGISLNFVQDLDGDGLTADVEFLLRTSDSPTIVGADFARGSVPVFTNTEFDWIYFGPFSDPCFATGTTVRVSADGGGLKAGNDYFIYRPYANNPIFYLYATKEAALAATPDASGRIDLTGDLTATIATGIPRGRDTDGDGLDDRFEALIGWTVTTPQRTYRVWSAPYRADSNFDGLDDAYTAPGGWDDRDGDGLRDRFNEVKPLPPQNGVTDWVLDPIRLDTDGDGINDAQELEGFNIVRITDGSTFSVKTDPTNPDTDYDTFTDGFEKQVGLDPTNGSDKDTDGDGLPDPVELAGWAVGRERITLDTARAVVPFITDLSSDLVYFSTNPILAPGTRVRVSAAVGGLTAGTDYFLGRVVSSGFPWYSFHTSRADALANSRRVDLTDGIAAQVIPVIANRGVEGVSVTPYQPGPLTAWSAKSRIDSADSDGDGLTDFDEFFLGTDPTSADTDGDGIADILELSGFRLPHKVGDADLGIITTDPLDADTDDDKRTDGAEAELQDVELSRWVVRVVGQAPYQVFSNPLVADADFDGLVDGDEITFGTDPNNGNTDGDRRDDKVEATGGSNPLAEDVRITVVARSVTILPAGQYSYALSVRKPDASGVAGLSGTPDRVYGSDGGSSAQVGKIKVTNTGAYIAKISYVYLVTLPNGGVSFNTTGEEGDLLAGQTVSYDPGARGVPLGSVFYVKMRAVAGNTITASQLFVYGGSTSPALAKYTSGGTTFIGTSFSYDGIEAPVALPQNNVPLAQRSVSFGLARGERFSIEGFVTQITTVGNFIVQLGGLEGQKAKEKVTDLTADRRTVFSYLEVADNDKFIEDYVFQAIVGTAGAILEFYFIID